MPPDVDPTSSRMEPRPSRGRALPLAASAVTLVLGLLVHRYPSLPLADKLGDVLYAALFGFLVWSLRPRAQPAALAAASFLWCLGIELLQLTDLPAAVAERIPLSRLVFGSGFDPLDLLAYAVGAAVVALACLGARRLTAPPAPASAPPPPRTR